MQPLTARLEVFGVGAVDRKAEMISSAGPDDALAHDGITRREPEPTDEPVSTTSPHHSWPGMIGYETGMM